MRTVTDVLDTIDRAVSDWETSPDAMRWTAKPPPVRPAPPREQIEAAWAALRQTVLWQWQSAQRAMQAYAPLFEAERTRRERAGRERRSRIRSAYRARRS